VTSRAADVRLPGVNSGRSSQRAQLHHLDATDRLAHLDCRLVQRIAAKKAQLEHPPVIGGQRVQNPFHPRGGVRRCGELVATTVDPYLVGELGFGNECAARPERRHHRAGGRIEVPSHRCSGVFAAQARQRLERDLLGELLGVGAVSDAGEDEGEDVPELA